MRRLCALAVLVLLLATSAAGAEVAKAQLTIAGLSLEVDRAAVHTAAGVPAYVQTIFGGRTNEQAPAAAGLVAMGELTGAGLDTPITLTTVPGQRFSLPALPEGEFVLGNIRLTGADGSFIQQAIPSFAAITVADVLQTEVRVRQLTAEELRERGISTDGSFESYEYTIVLAVDGKTVEIPYPVIVDTRTHTLTPVNRESPYQLPRLSVQQPPRFRPPSIQPFEFEPVGGSGPLLPPPSSGGAEEFAPRPRIPAALVIPSGFGVLHQFFAIILEVTNAAPLTSQIVLDSVTASIQTPLQMRVAKVTPAVTLGQPVPIYSTPAGTTYLIAGARGKAEWSVEALKAGTHTLDVTVNATYKNAGQPDMPLRGKVSASLVVSDPRFQINFSHPDVVRDGESYSAYAFVTNLSPQRQHVVLDGSLVPACSSGAVVDNICRAEGEGATALDLEPGQMKPVLYKLTSRITGNVYAAAGAASDESIGVGVKLTMGVSASGIPLSPATLVMPHYARYLPSEFVAAQMQLLGLGYSLATAPLNQYTARLPRVITTDVFLRAQSIARAGQRVFVEPAGRRSAFHHLALDLLGNVERVDQLALVPELKDWDELRRSETSGRTAAAALARQLEQVPPQQFVDEFAASTSHRSPFLLALVEGGALRVTGRTTGNVLDGPAEAASGWSRGLPYGELMKFGSGAQLALIGRWTENLQLTITPTSPQITLHAIWPDTADGAQLRTTITMAATPGTPLTIDLARGDRTRGSPVVPVPLSIVGAAQDLHLDAGGHIVSVLFNRPIHPSDPKQLRDLVALTTAVAKASYSATRRNGAQLQIPGAALQEDGRLLNISFDKTLSRNAVYTIALDPVESGASAMQVVPRIDNDRPGAILTGSVLRGDNSAVPAVLVELRSNGVRQLDVTGPDGRFLYEFVPRDVDRGISGAYRLSTAAENKTASLEGTVRLPGEVHTVNLVFLGRGSARGQVRYSDGVALGNAKVTVGSTLFSQFRTAQTDANGNYQANDLPVGPLTFSVVDPTGRATYAANQIRAAGEVVTQDLVIERREFAGRGSVVVTVRRSDTNETVAGARAGVYSQGYGLQDGLTDANGRIEFADVPAGLVSVLVSHWGLTRESAAVELDLRPDQRLEPTVVLRIAKATDPAFAALEGTVTLDGKALGGAVIAIAGLPPISSNADGTYLYADVPLALSGATLTVFDAVSGRRGAFSLPTLVSGTNHFPLQIVQAAPEGVATMRVRLTSATGTPVTGYRVFSPGYPPQMFIERGNGVYELPNVRVPRWDEVVAVSSGADGQYGWQLAQGRIRVDFHGQVGVLDLRLPGQGRVIARFNVNGGAATGPAQIALRAWDEAEQSVTTTRYEVVPDATTGLVTFDKVPARQTVSVSSVRHPLGHATATTQVGYEGDVRTVDLNLESMGAVSGRVLAHDRLTPVSGALVRLQGGAVQLAPQLTLPDGSFRFPAVAAGVSFRIIAEQSSDTIYRTGYADGSTASAGGTVEDLVVVMREQSSVEGRVVNQSGAAVPLAHYWARELAWPYRTFGTAQDPRRADASGRFVIANVFTGDFRITAVDPNVQELRGDYQGTIEEEGDIRQQNVDVRIGATGIGALSVTVVDPEFAFAPVNNAEVALYRGSTRFDFTTTDTNGAAFFDRLPAGTYRVTAYAKTVGRGGTSASFAISADTVASQRVELTLRGSVSGDVTDPEAANAPVIGSPVTLVSGSVSTRASTDGAGLFNFAGVPEGPFRLSAFDLDSGRVATGPAGLFISPLVTEQKNIHLQLERFGQLTVRAYLPNDSGGPGVLAPLVDVLVEQKSVLRAMYTRQSQGNALLFPRMLRRYGYSATVKELGGENRTVKASGSFGSDEYAAELTVVFPTWGTVEVSVIDGTGQPVADAQVQINNRTLYTPANGIVSLSGLPLGWISVQARKGSVGASQGGELTSRTVPLRMTLNLGTTVTPAGTVEAEGGGPSPNTRVLLDATSRHGGVHLEAMTGSDGSYTFSGVPVGGTSVTLKYYGPDDTTLGAVRTMSVPDGATGVITIPSVRIDATPPRVLSIVPAANETSVSPTSTIIVTFSEAIASSFLTSQWFQLVATDDGTRPALTITPILRPDGTYVVKLTPSAPLRSNLLYRFTVPQGIQDTTGNALRAAVGVSFTTVDYTEPAVVRVDPPESLPIAANQTFRIKFNKSIDVTAFASSAVLVMERLDRHRGIPVAAVPIVHYADTEDATAVIVAPTGVAFAESSFYRLTIAGARDTHTPPNVQKVARIADFFSYDTVKPTVRLLSPSADEKLVDGVAYTASVESDSDTAYVDFFGGDDKLLARDNTAPFSYSFVAGGTSFTLKTGANDLSGNASAMESRTWTVVPNLAPTDVVVTNTPASAYPSHRVETRVSFKDEGLSVAVSAVLRGVAVGSKSITRASTSVPFADAVFSHTLPVDLAPGATEVVVTASDSVRATTVAAPLNVLADTTPPAVVALLPKGETRYPFNAVYTVEFKVKDAETGIARADITVGGVLLTAVTSTFDATTGIRTFRKDVTVPPKNTDTRVAIVATAFDHHGNTASATVSVVYERVADATLPRAAWVTPLDGATLPLGQSGWQTTLRIRATDDTKVTSVRFDSTSFNTVTLTEPKAGTTDIFEAKVSLAMPATSFVITATVSDGQPGHDVELPINIEPLTLDVPAVVSADLAITSGNAALYRDKSLVVRGSGAKVYVTIPFSLKNLVLLDGAILSNPEETRLEVDVAERVFVDADSSIDLTAKGSLGGWRKREDNSFTNDSAVGMVNGRTRAVTQASGSHGGLGGGNGANESYGSPAEPSSFGSGGAGSGTGTPGGNGGGAIRLQTPVLVLAGAVRADGGSGVGGAFAGSGGSIVIGAPVLIGGPATGVTANGGDDDGAINDHRGGGGGRVAITVSERLELDAVSVQARGGRNGTASEGTAYTDGGAGTVVTNGALVVSAFDQRYPLSTHRTRGTPIEGSFASVTLGPRVLARFDGTVPALTADATAQVVGPTELPVVALVPLAPGDVPQGATITPRYSASSPAGVGEVRVISSTQPNEVVHATGTFPTNIAETAAPIAVAADAQPGPATLRLRVLDRAGRIAHTSAVSFNVIANKPPVIEAFTVAAESYAGRTLTVSATVTDDVEVKSVTLAARSGVVTKTAPSAFTVAIPRDAPSQTDLVLTLSVSDDRTTISETKNVRILKDSSPPVLTVSLPQPNSQFDEGAGRTITVQATVIDAEVGVKRVVASLDGVEHTMTDAGGVYTATIAVPSVEGSEPVAKTITVTASDYEPNVVSASIPIFVKPLIDPNAPLLSWLCGSPNSLYPSGTEAVIRVRATPSSPVNGVQKVDVRVGETTIAATNTGGDVWEARATVTGALAIRVAAASVANNESILLGSIATVSGTEFTTKSTIEAADTAFENRTLIVKAGGELTIVGAHRFADLVVLDGGRVVQQHLDKGRADLVDVTRLSVACGGSIDVTGLGYPMMISYPGAGLPDERSGGSHVGRGGLYSHQAGGVFGSITAPRESGGGGHVPSFARTSDMLQAAGGGSVRIAATGAVVVDGRVLANSTTHGAGGSVWIRTAAQMTGGGSIEARGADGVPDASGGGGAVALEYASAAGEVLSNTTARAGTTNGHAGAAGTVYRNGDVSIENAAASPFAVTELPSLGTAMVTGVSGASIATDLPWIAPWLEGHSVRVYAPDGSVRGTFRIAAITNTATPLPGFAEVKTQDGIAYDGYLLQTPNGVVAGRYLNGKWELDDDTSFNVYIPSATDAVFASFRKDAQRITGLELLRCAAGCGSVHGIAIRELASGEIRPNMAAGAPASDPTHVGNRKDDGEFFLRPDSRGRGLLLTSGGGASLTLDNAAAVQQGDSLRGVHRFRNLTMRNARVVSEDLVETTGTRAIDGTSSLFVNEGAPTLTAGSIVRGLRGPLLTVSASDPDVPVDVIAGSPASPWWTRHEQVEVGDGGTTLRRVQNGGTSSAGISTLDLITDSGHVAFSASQTNVDAAVGLAPADTTTSLNEPQFSGFKVRSTGMYEVWANGVNANRTGSYTTASVFRVEKTAYAMRWIVDEAVVHETTASIPAAAVLDVSFGNASSGEIRGVVYDTVRAGEGAQRASVAPDGTFRVPMRGVQQVRARDHAFFSLQSRAITVPPVPADFAVASLALELSEVAGGRPVTATVTLAAPAGSEGAFVELISGNVNVVIPPSVVVPPNASSASFIVTTKPVFQPADAQLLATYAGQGAMATLRVVKDSTPPQLSITAPLPNAQFSEGSANKITVDVNATDDASGVARVYATIDGAVTELARDAGKGANVWTGRVPAPYVDGTSPLTKQLLVTAVDVSANASSASVAVAINPIISANAPTVSWTCGSNGAYVSGGTATLRVFAKAANTANPLQRVDIIIGSSDAVAATSVGSDQFELAWSAPAVVTDTTFEVRAVAIAASGVTSDVRTRINVVVPDQTFSASSTIGANDLQYEGKTIVVTAGTLTIAGTHSFRNLVVSGGSVTHPALDATGAGAFALTVSGSVYVACNALIDVNGKGWPVGTTQSGATLPGVDSGGSHIGVGGMYTAPSASTFGSVTAPREAGGGGSTGGAGGGVVRIIARDVGVDGIIRAKGTTGSTSAGASGSIWITATRIAGSGTIDTSGNNACRRSGGGGGAIAVEYTDSDSTLPEFLNRDTVNCSGPLELLRGGPGTTFVRGPLSQFGDLTIENGSTNGVATDLPALGGGVALAGTSGATLVTDRSADIPTWFNGHWVEIGGKGTWRIAAINGKSVTLEPNASEMLALVPGDRWQGVYRFDSVMVVGRTTLVSADPLRVTGLTTLAGLTNSTEPLIIEGVLDMAKVHVTGRVAIGKADVQELTVAAGATLQARTSLLTIDAHTLVVAGVISASGMGFAASTGYPGVTPLPGANSGGAHIGTGGLSTAPSAATFGSVYRPAEPGGGGAAGGAGGGVVRIRATSLTINGEIRANGASGGNAGGAGGSIFVSAGRVSGIGTVEANGASECRSGGGGGAVSVEYSDPSSALPTVQALGGAPTCAGIGDAGKGGAGSVYVRGPQSTYGSLTISASSGRAATELPSLGSGVALAGTSGATLVTDRASDIPVFFAGHWIEIAGKGSWRITSVNARAVTLAPNGSETISLAPGDRWQGVYLFDDVTVSGGIPVASSDPIRVPSGLLTISPGSTGVLTQVLTPVVASRVLITGAGTVLATSVKSDELTVDTGATLGSLGSTLDIDSSTIVVGGSISANGKGYPASASYPGVTPLPGVDSGGAHIGRGGLSTAPYAATFGSVYRPAEPGGGGEAGGAGGGVLRIRATALTVNGNIRANGAGGGGAGGSVWITAAKITGTGMVEANGGSGCRAGGGGGAIAVEYSDPSSVPPALQAVGVAPSCAGIGLDPGRGGAGSVYVRGPQSTYGSLTIAALSRRAAIELPSLGSGIALAGSTGATLVTDRASDIPPFFAGHWVEIAGKGTWRIASVGARTVTLSANGSEAISLAPGDRWQGVYLFDDVMVSSGIPVMSADPLRIPTGLLTLRVTESAETMQFLSPIVVPRVRIAGDGTVKTTTVKADELTIDPGAALGALSNSLDVDAQTLLVNGSIDVSGQGYAAGATDPGATPAGLDSGGAHIGQGGVTTNAAASTFGSITDPNEPGGSGGGGGAGGGVLRITAQTMTLAGAIRANGASGGNAAGAGGSVRIAVAKITGSGSIIASGGTECRAGGGGGAIALRYTDPASVLPTMTAAGGSVSCSGINGAIGRGGAGTLFTRGPAATRGEVTVNGGNRTGQPTTLPSLGSGIAQPGSAGAVLVTDRTADIPSHFVGHSVDVEGKGTFRVAAVSGRSVTLEGTPNVSPGDPWRGVHRFDKLILRLQAKVLSSDRIDAVIDTDTSSSLTMNAARPQLSSATLSSGADGNFVVGAAGAVVDVDVPIQLTATNLRTQQLFTGSAAPDGSFRIAVSGIVGDTFALFATDSHALPMRSRTIVVSGAVTTASAIPNSTIAETSTTAPPSLAGVTFEAAVVQSGASVRGMVILSAPAPAGGALVSFDGAFEVLVREGDLVAPFTVQAPQVAEPVTFTVTASYRATVTAQLEVRPAR